MRQFFTLIGLCLSVVLATPAIAADQVLISDLVSPDGIQSAVLSPDGKHIAAIKFNGHGRRLMIFDTDTMESETVVYDRKAVRGNYEYEKSPRRATWVTNSLIAVDYGYVSEAINLDGKYVSELGEQVIGKADQNNADSPILLIYTDAKSGNVAQVNALTGKKTRFRVPMSGTQISNTFDSKGELRAVTMVDSEFWNDVTRISNWYKTSANGDWVKLAEFGVNDDYWSPISIPAEPDKLIVTSRLGRDTHAIFEFDTKTLKMGEMLAGHPSQDILSVSGDRDVDFLRVVTSGMISQTVWFDPRWGGLQKSVDAALPGRKNRLSGDPKNRVLVLSYADVDPGRWYLLDTNGMKLREFGAVQTSIKPAQMRKMESVSYASKDGLTIPAYLTRPTAAGAPGPAVIMIHGGPTVRDYWGFDEEVQFLASRGYVVFQPQFRGSTGFGRKFETAGYGQWGKAMQDDVTAGVEWLIAQGIADPARICIYGASYGGYAALWGLVKTPDLYKCGISFAGVSDIELMFKDSSDRNSDKIVRQIQRSRIGDIRHNKVEFDAVSPLKHADKITAPVLLMHGKDDERVPIVHSRQMKRALEKYKKTVELVEFDDEGHGLVYVTNKAWFLTKMNAYLEKNIGPGSPQPAVDAVTPVSPK
jgi:dipeptidyl aminopeptidase/acylaminoacyl peptidase